MILAIRTDKPEAELYILDKTEILETDTWEAGKKLSVELHAHIEALLATASVSQGELEGVVAFEGPGSFTGLRIGISVANTYAYALGIPVAGASGDDWLQQGVKKLEDTSIGVYAMPHYDRGANITRPRK